jgi:uncharacterized membrane protein
MARRPRTLEELNRVITGERISAGHLETLIKGYDRIPYNKRKLDEYLEKLKETVNSERERLEILEDLKDLSAGLAGSNSDLVKSLKQQITSLSKILKVQRSWRDEVNKIGRAYSKVLRSNEEIFKISHQMQLESNVTWKNYTKLYDGAYQSARKMTREVGKSLLVAKDYIQAQNKLLGTGWKNIKPADLVNVASSVSSLTLTLGTVPEDLAMAFQISYRQFGSQTDKFITSLGNRINAFSETFGAKLGDLTNVVSDMMASNSFIARNNMEAQVLANESLLKAASLSAAIGVSSSNFISSLAGVAQFGTMEEMSKIYQGGAMLQGFDTAQFQEQMVGQDYEGATMSLFRSVADTLNSIDDHYLRAEYMQRIGGTFGLSRDDLLMIMQNSDNINAYSEDLQEKLKGIDTSMVDELRDLKMNWTDRLERWIENTPITQGIGGILQSAGLFGTADYLKSILTWVQIIGAKFVLGSAGGALGKIGTTAIGQKILGTGSGTGNIGLLGLAKSPLGIGLGGLGIAAGGNILGSSIQQDMSRSDTGANLLGGALNVGSGALGGAMIGSAIPVVGTLAGTLAGAAIGATVGAVNTFMSARERERSIIEEIDERASAGESQTMMVSTGNPIVDTLEKINTNLTNVINGNFSESRRFQVVLDTYKKTTTYEGL